MPARKVAPYRPTVREIQKLLREAPEAHWIDAERRTYGFMSTELSSALWHAGTMQEDEAHMWVLLPSVEYGQKRGEYATFPAPGEAAELRPYVRPKDAARLSVTAVKYLYRPRRQRAAALVASVREYSRVDAPTGAAIAAKEDREARN
jgi:hypothetical protein